MSEWEEFLNQPIRVSERVQILYKHAIRCLWCGEIIWKPNSYTDEELAICSTSCYEYIANSKKELHELVFKEIILKNKRLYAKLEEGK